MKPTLESSFILITRVVELWNNEVTQLLNEHTLTQSEFTMLASIYSHTKESQSVTQVNLCTYTGIKQMNASILLRKLQDRKFVSRKEHPIDTRAKTVHLTKLGEQTAVEILAEIETLNYHFFQLSKESEIVFVNKLQVLRDNNYHSV